MRLWKNVFFCGYKLSLNLPAGLPSFTSMKLLIRLHLLLFTLQANAQQTELSVPGQNLFVNKIHLAQNLNSDLNGAGITVSIKEFAFDTNDVDLKGRVLPSPNAATNLTTHANIMASLVGGAGNADLQGRGAAPGCQLVSSSFVGLLPDADYWSQNITVQNHSYGINIQNWYGAGAVSYDQTTDENPFLLHVFSAGNKGDSAALSGTYANLPGMANLSGNFKMAKNVLLVGAVDSLARMDPFSSSGPAYDGRTKPDLVAFGLDGTSGAAALVSGSAAVIQQTLLYRIHEFPHADLVRAVLINGATDIDPPGPDFQSGFGSLDLKKSLEHVYREQVMREIIDAGQTRSIPLIIPQNIHQAKITLVWNDPTAALFSPKALLHDLDLVLLDPLGNEYSPWVLNSFPNADSLRQAAHRGRDTLNNVEQVTLDFPQAGLWEIRVSAPLNLLDQQKFALAWNWDTMKHFEWVYPYANAPTPAGKEVILHWESNLSDSFGRLEWRPWPSPDWRLIDNAVDLNAGFRRWTLPDTFAESQVRMVVGGYNFNSSIFLISKELRMKIGFNCPDSVMLYWNTAHPSAEYQLFGLGQTQLEPLTIVKDTFIVLQKSNYPQARFAVAPLAPWKDAQGPRSPAPDISKQGVSCYFHGFLANLNPDFGVDLDLTLGTNYGLSKIFFEKQTNGAFVVLDERHIGSLEYSFLDEFPQKGINTYRARVWLDNGAMVVSDTATVYFAGEKNWWVFPNPVPSEGVLNLIATPEEQAEFYLYDVLGKLVLEKTADELLLEIPLRGLSKGIYFYKIKDGKVFLGGGRLVVE